jgi:hypothetical protein
VESKTKNNLKIQILRRLATRQNLSPKTKNRRFGAGWAVLF